MSRVVPAVARALDLLGLFLDSRILSVPEITTRLGLPRSTTHELVHTLAACGFLAQSEVQPHRFALGLRVFELGSSYASNLDLIREGTVVIRDVSLTTDETTQLAVLDGNQVVYVAKADSTQAVRLASTVGGRLAAHVTALGKMLLSGISDETVIERYGGLECLPGMTANSITSLARLLAELSDVRSRGIAFDNCESNPDLRCVAAPVYDHEGTMVAAVSIAVPVTRMSAERQARLADLIRKAGETLSYRLGYRSAAWSPALSTQVASLQRLSTNSALIEHSGGG